MIYRWDKLLAIWLLYAVTLTKYVFKVNICMTEKRRLSITLQIFQKSSLYQEQTFPAGLYYNAQNI